MLVEGKWAGYGTQNLQLQSILADLHRNKPSCCHNRDESKFLVLLGPEIEKKWEKCVIESL